MGASISEVTPGVQGGLPLVTKKVLKGLDPELQNRQLVVRAASNEYVGGRGVEGASLASLLHLRPKAGWKPPCLSPGAPSNGQCPCGPMELLLLGLPRGTGQPTMGWGGGESRGLELFPPLPSQRKSPTLANSCLSVCVCLSLAVLTWPETFM